MDKTPVEKASVVAGKYVRVSEEAARVGAPTACATSDEPQIEMIRDGDILRAIDIKCACGRQIRLRCIPADRASPA